MLDISEVNQIEGGARPTSRRYTREYMNSLSVKYEAS